MRVQCLAGQQILTEIFPQAGERSDRLRTDAPPLDRAAALRFDAGFNVIGILGLSLWTVPAHAPVQQRLCDFATRGGLTSNPLIWRIKASSVDISSQKSKQARSIARPKPCFRQLLQSKCTIKGKVYTLPYLANNDFAINNIVILINLVL